MNGLDDMPDGELVRLTRQGSAEAYRPLVARYQGHVYGLAYSIIGDWAEAQDIAQEAFIRAYSNLDQLREPAKFAAWLRRVAFGVAMDWVRTFRPKLHALYEGKIDLENLEIPDFAPGPAEVAERRELADAVLRAVASLPPKYRVPLTMFHLDGLSYQKVADFLDIPLGTAKSMIHRAREQLKAALSAAQQKETTAMLQEVFNEHKLPAEFASKVLDGVAALRWDRWECPWCGPVSAYLEYVGDPVPYEYVMGVSGSAFKLLWMWCASNNSPGLIGGLTDRTLRLLGYEGEHITKPQTEETFRRKVMDSIDQGRPVLGGPLVGSPDPDIIAGYEEAGATLLGQSYHCEKGYFHKSDWYGGIMYLTLIRPAAGGRPDKPLVLRESLQWAIKLARTADLVDQRVSGLAGYEAWVDALERDEDFPAGDLNALTFRCLVNASVTLSGLFDARRSAAAYLRMMADVEPAVREQLRHAAEQYDRELGILRPMMQIAPFCHGPNGTEQRRLEMADPALRRRLSKLIREAKAVDEAAVASLEQAAQRLNR